jgi:rhodanese-related sulfurtransferase
MPVRTVDVAALKDALASEKPPTLLDVRSAAEFAGGHVPGAINVPLGEIGGRLGEFDGEVWLICRSGSRSSGAAKEADQQGRTVVNVSGGTIAWRMSGGAVDRERSAAVFVMPVLASLTLGLAPFFPQPHVVEKLGMLVSGDLASIDWFDLLMHGAPWLWLARTAWLQWRAR